jgi:hypothetical protein
MAAKKKFPGIFYVIAISFVVYLTVVTAVIVFHYQKPKKGNANKNIQVSSAPIRLLDQAPIFC